MRAIAAWRQAGQISASPLIRSIDVHFDGSPRHINPRPMHVNSNNHIYQRLVRQAWKANAFPVISLLLPLYRAWEE